MSSNRLDPSFENVTGRTKIHHFFSLAGDPRRFYPWNGRGKHGSLDDGATSLRAARSRAAVDDYVIGEFEKSLSLLLVATGRWPPDPRLYLDCRNKLFATLLDIKYLYVKLLWNDGGTAEQSVPTRRAFTSGW